MTPVRDDSGMAGQANINEGTPVIAFSRHDTFYFKQSRKK
jgi:hypothetical protein